MIAAIQTHRQLLHWHPHLHVLITCGVGRSGFVDRKTLRCRPPE
ncbi:transposase [Neorhodopirellula pilleata]